MDVPYITRETWMTCMSYIRKLCRQLQELLEDREGDGNAGDKMLVATVEPSELQGPPGSSLLWSVACAKVL